MTDYKELISALRCSANVCNGKCDESCPYRTLEEMKPDFPLKADVTINGIGYWASCDYDRMILDAADAIEKLVNDRNASMDALKALRDNCVVVDGTPCDFCTYNPPSSLDGKPCTMCPACKRREGGSNGE